MGEEAESWTNQTQGLIIPGNLMGLLRFYVDVNTLWIFPDSQLHSHRASFLMPSHVSHISSHICHLGTCKQKRKCGETEVLWGWQLWTLLSTYDVDCEEHLCPHQWGSWEPGLCLQLLQYRDLGFVHSPWSVTLDKRTRIQLSSVCLADRGPHCGPMLRRRVLSANKLF